MILMLNFLVLSSYAQGGIWHEVKVTCDGRTETVVMGRSGTEESAIISIADSISIKGYIPYAHFLIDDNEKSKIAAYKKELKDWALQLIKEIIPSDTLQQIKKMRQENKDTYFFITLYFDNTGKTTGFSLIVSTKLYEKLTQEQLVRIVFRIKDLEGIPFTKYYDFTKPDWVGFSSRYYGKILFDVCELLVSQEE